MQHKKVQHPKYMIVVGADLVRALVDNSKTKVLQHRQHVRQMDRLVFVEEL